MPLWKILKFGHLGVKLDHLGARLSAKEGTHVEVRTETEDAAVQWTEAFKALRSR